MSRPCQKGEFTDSASSSGRCARMRLASLIAVLGIVDSDVHVQGESRLTPGELAHRPVDQLVALAARDHRLVPDGEGVRGRAGAVEPERRQLVVQPAPHAEQLVCHAGHAGVHAGAQLEGGAVGLRGDVRRQLRGHGGQHAVDLLGERPVVRD